MDENAEGSPRKISRRQFVTGALAGSSGLALLLSRLSSHAQPAPEIPPTPIVDVVALRKQELKNIERAISDKENETVGESAFFAINSNGESVGVNADKEFQTWSLIKIPLAMLVMKDIRSHVIKTDSTHVENLLYQLLRNSDNSAFTELTRIVTGENNWDIASSLIAKRIQDELGMEHTSYKKDPNLDYDVGLFYSTASDLGKVFMQALSPTYPPKDRQKITEAIEFQLANKLTEESDDRLGYYRRRRDLPGVSTGHKIGNSEPSSAQGFNWHDMGFFTRDDGTSVVYACLNGDQPQTLDAVNDFQSFALDRSLETLGGVKTVARNPQSLDHL